MGEAEQLTISSELARSLARAPRVEHEAVVRIFCAGRNGIHTGFLRNLSSGGMFLHIVDPEPTGTRLHFELRLDPKRPEVVTGSGEVAFRREVYGGPGRPPGMGVRFLALTPEGASALEARLGERPRAAIVDDAGPETPRIDTPEPPSETRSTPPTAPDPVVAAPPAAAERVPDEAEPESDLDWEDLLDPGTSPSRAAAGRLLAVAVVLLTLVGVGLWLRGRSPGAQVSAGTPSSAEPSVASPPLAEAAPTNLAETPEASETPPQSPPDPAVSVPLTRVTEIRWEEGPDSLVVVVEGDGAFDPGRATYSHIGGENPRGVVRIRDVERAVDRFRNDLASDLVATIRTGYHEGSGGRGDLHLVLDFRDPGARITGVLPAGTELLVYVGRS